MSASDRQKQPAVEARYHTLACVVVVVVSLSTDRWPTHGMAGHGARDIRIPSIHRPRSAFRSDRTIPNLASIEFVPGREVWAQFCCPISGRPSVDEATES